MLRYTILGHRVGIRCQSDQVSETFSHVLDGFRDTCARERDETWDVTGEGPFEAALRNERALTCSDLTTVVSVVEFRILLSALKASGLVGLHAAAACKHKRTVILTGKSGSGKTTLILGLLTRGWRLLTDEIVVVDRKSRRLVLFPRTVRATASTVKLFSNSLLGDKLCDPGIARPFGDKVCLRTGRLPLAEHREYEASDVFFLKLDENTTSMRHVKRAEGFTRLMDQAIGKPEEAFDTLAKLAARVSFYELTHAQIEPALDLIEQPKAH